MTDPTWLDAIARADLVRRGEVSPKELVEAAIGRIEAVNHPAVSLPLHWTLDGLPVGVRLVAGYRREDLLIRVAGQFERAAPWSDRRPQVRA